MDRGRQDCSHAHVERLQTFLEDVYHAKRLHSSLDHMPPDEFELQFESSVNVWVVWTFWGHSTMSNHTDKVHLYTIRSLC
jgi:hypothetical protein